MEHIQGIAWGIAAVVAILSFMVTVFAVLMGLPVGIFLSFLAFFVPSLRRIAPYSLLIPFCAAVAGCAAFRAFLNITGRHLEDDQFIRAGLVGPWAAFTLGALAGASLGFLLAKLLTRSWQRPVVPLTPTALLQPSRK